MKIAVFVVEYTVKAFDRYPIPVPKEFRSEFRLQLFNELIEQAKNKKVDIAVLPGGFFRTNSSGGIANALKHKPPDIKVVVGRDSEAGNLCEAWVINKSGSISRRIQEAWIYKNKKREETLDSITDRRFQHNNKMYAVYSCGDIIIDKRKFAYSKAAFVLAHSSAPGRSFTPAMRKIGIPIFLSHHVRDPYNTVSYAYNGKYKKNKPKLIKEPWGEFQGLKWIARVYSV